MYNKLKDYLKQHPEILSKKYSFSSLKKNHKEFLNELQNIDWLKPYKFHWKKILFYVINDLTEIQLCKVCKQKEAIFHSLEKGYSRTCSKQCASKDPNRTKKIQQTFLKKYGVNNASQVEEVKEKKKQTCLKHYGVDHPLKVEHLAHQVSAKNKEKAQQTTEKIKTTNLHKYGKEFYTQTNSYKERMSKLWNDKNYRAQRINKIRTYTADEDFREKQRSQANKRWKNIDNKQHQQICQTISNTLKQTFSNEKKKKEITEKRARSLLKNAADELIKKLNIDRNNIKDANKLIKYYSSKGTSNKYGVDTVFQLDNIQEKCRATIKRKFNVDNISQHLSFKKKLRQKAIDRVYTILSNDFEILDIQIFTNDYKKSFLKLRCKNCSKEFQKKIHGVRYEHIHCPFCKKISSIESIVKEILTSANLNYISQDRQLISPYEVDFFLPEYNLAIETNGLYWHSDLFVEPGYHQMKYKLCQQKGIKLLQFFEDELMDKTDIVKSIILSNCNIYSKVIHGRKCIIKEITARQKNMFLHENHLMGEDRSTIKLGAFYDDNLVAVMTFHSGNITINSLRKTTTWEMSRFCSKKFYKVHGIAGKLFSYFTHNYVKQGDTITTYASLRTGDGSTYKKLGFTFVSITQPGYFYVKGFRRLNRFHAISNRKDRTLCERDDMLKQGFVRIFDAGNNKYIWSHMTRC